MSTDTRSQDRRLFSWFRRWGRAVASSKRPKERRCKYCDQPFKLTNKHPNQRHCSRECLYRQRRKERGVTLEPTVGKRDPMEWIGLLRYVVAYRTKIRPIEDSDEYQIAWVALLEACEQHAQRSSLPFDEYAANRMRYAIYKHGKSNRKHNAVRLESSEYLTSDAMHPPAPTSLPEEYATANELYEAVSCAIEKLPGHRQAILSLRMRGQNWRLIGKRYGLTPRQVDYQLDYARAALREVLTDWGFG